MSLSSTSNSISSSGTFNSNSSINASADKYAALKDLDEQFKIEKSDTFSGGLNNASASANNGINNNTTVNPFKVAPNPFQQQQQQIQQQQMQQQHQQAQFNWASSDQSFAANNGGFFGTNFTQQSTSPQQNAVHTNGFAAQYNTYNGYENSSSRINNNGGFGVQAGAKSAFGNPFMVRNFFIIPAGNFSFYRFFMKMSTRFTFYLICRLVYLCWNKLSS
jgi:hypothetical protein